MTVMKSSTVFGERYRTILPDPHLRPPFALLTTLYRLGLELALFLTSVNSNSNRVCCWVKKDIGFPHPQTRALWGKNVA